jgi:DNA transformation protein
VGLEDVVELFSAFGPVTVHRMFGGAGIYANDTMFGLIVDGTVYLKVGASNAAMFERDRCEPFTCQTKAGKRSSMSYRCMPERAVRRSRRTRSLGTRGLVSSATVEIARVPASESLRTGHESCTEEGCAETLAEVRRLWLGQRPRDRIR